MLLWMLCLVATMPVSIIRLMFCVCPVRAQVTYTVYCASSVVGVVVGHTLVC